MAHLMRDRANIMESILSQIGKSPVWNHIHTDDVRCCDYGWPETHLPIVLGIGFSMQRQIVTLSSVFVPNITTTGEDNLVDYEHYAFRLRA